MTVQLLSTKWIQLKNKYSETERVFSGLPDALKRIQECLNLQHSNLKNTALKTLFKERILIRKLTEEHISYLKRQKNKDLLSVVNKCNPEPISNYSIGIFLSLYSASKSRWEIDKERTTKKKEIFACLEILRTTLSSNNSVTLSGKVKKLCKEKVKRMKMTFSLAEDPRIFPIYVFGHSLAELKEFDAEKVAEIVDDFQAATNFREVDPTQTSGRVRKSLRLAK